VRRHFLIVIADVAGAFWIGTLFSELDWPYRLILTIPLACFMLAAVYMVMAGYRAGLADRARAEFGRQIAELERRRRGMGNGH
jgi:membrane protein implicated in regulation of membrane protease activity